MIYGYKLWIGDLPTDSDLPDIMDRVDRTLHKANLDHLFAQINHFDIPRSRAASGATAVVLTIHNLAAAVVTQSSDE